MEFYHQQSVDLPSVIQHSYKIAKGIAGKLFFPDEDEVTMVILRGYESGLPPFY
jgi:hypothetical protein